VGLPRGRHGAAHRENREGEHGSRLGGCAQPRLRALWRWPVFSARVAPSARQVAFKLRRASMPPPHGYAESVIELFPNSDPAAARSWATASQSKHRSPQVEDAIRDAWSNCRGDQPGLVYAEDCTRVSASSPAGWWSAHRRCSCSTNEEDGRRRLGRRFRRFICWKRWIDGPTIRGLAALIRSQS